MGRNHQKSLQKQASDVLILHVLTWLGEPQAGFSQVVQLSNAARGESEELGACRFTLDNVRHCVVDPRARPQKYKSYETVYNRSVTVSDGCRRADGLHRSTETYATVRRLSDLQRSGSCRAGDLVSFLQR